MILTQPSRFRTLLVLGRVSNLPTVWSNCLAGWWLGGGGSVAALVKVSVWVSLLYIAGMYLNDAFDARFDRNHRSTRPIPTGQISERAVWLWGFAWLILGLTGLVWMGGTTAGLSFFLAASILLYNAVHKIVPIAPVIMGLCRLLVYLEAASAAIDGVTGETVWKGIALASYIAGLSCLARKESAPVQMRYWPSVFLTAPVLAACLFDDSADKWVAAICAIIVTVWVAWTILQTYGREHPSVGRVVSHLLAGIALVDLLAVADISHGSAIFFPLWFMLALFLQSFIPAT